MFQSGGQQFKKKPFSQQFGQKRTQGFRKFNKPAYDYVQRAMGQARSATIEEIDEDQEYQEYGQEENQEVNDIAARTARLNEDEREALIREMAGLDPDF